MRDKTYIAILLAVLAAALYAVSTPVSKALLQVVPPTMIAAFLYIGAGIGVGIMMLIGQGKKNQSGVRYHDTYVKQDGKWLIKKRESDFMFTTVEDMPK